ncbi:MAG TPA: hypothetical protein VFS52_19310 [Steroidobacteraceae bacterium]|jgi:hypothetical protein|nr:hypothetical protein [Steroidobacteraceae bacterium]
MRPLERFPSRDPLIDDIRQRLRELPAERQPPYDWAEFRRRAREQRAPHRSAVKWEHAAAAAGITVLIASLAMWARSDHQTRAELEVSGTSVPPVVAANPVTPRSGPANESGEAIARAASADSGEHSAASEPDATRAPNSAWTREQMAQLNEQVNANARERSDAVSRAALAAVSAQFAALGAAPTSRRWLAQQPAEPSVVRVGSRLAVANLEDRIAWVDDALSDAEFTQADAAGVQALRQERARLLGSLAQVRYAETLAAQAP